MLLQDCKIISVNVMECKSPSIIAPGVNVTETSPLEVHYGFVMASVAALENVSYDKAFGPLWYYPDPYVAPFTEEDKTKKFQDKDLLSIQVYRSFIDSLCEFIVKDLPFEYTYIV